MNTIDEIKGEVEGALKQITEKFLFLNKISARTWIILGVVFAFFSAFWEWIVGWLGSLILGRTFFIYPYSSLVYTSVTGIITWGLFTTILMFIAMQVTKLSTVTILTKDLKADYGQVRQVLKDKFVLPKKLPTRYVVIAGFAGAIIGTMCEGLWGWVSQFFRGHITYIYPGSVLKYTSFASIPIWGMFSAIFFVFGYNLILWLERPKTWKNRG
jgi:magnesium-transporting ATPase (P-type)